jgi:hypothetical protein
VATRRSSRLPRYSTHIEYDRAFLLLSIEAIDVSTVEVFEG